METQKRCFEPDFIGMEGMEQAYDAIYRCKAMTGKDPAYLIVPAPRLTVLGVKVIFSENVERVYAVQKGRE